MNRTKKSKWFALDKRAPVLSVRVAGLNLQGHTQKGFFFSRELKTTLFNLEFSIANYRWTVSKSFDELKLFFQQLRSDDALFYGREMLQVRYSLLYNQSQPFSSCRHLFHLEMKVNVKLCNLSNDVK